MSDRPDKIDKFLPETRSAVKRAGRAMSEVGERRDEAEKARVETEPPAAILSARRTVRVLVEMAAWKKTVLAVGAVVLPLVVFVVASRGKDRGHAAGFEIEGAPSGGTGTTASAVTMTGRPASMGPTSTATASVTATAGAAATSATTRPTDSATTTTGAPGTPSGSVTNGGGRAPKAGGDPYGEKPGSKAVAPAVSPATSTANAPAVSTVTAPTPPWEEP